MFEYGGQFTITGEDGTAIVANNGSSGIYLDAIDGLDSPTVRQSVDAIPEADGALASDFYYGSKSGILRGKLVAATAAARNPVAASMQRAFRALRADMTIDCTPSGMPAMRLYARTEQPLRFTGGMVKDWIVGVVAADPRWYSQATNTVNAVGAVKSPGAAFPLHFPVDFGGGSGSTLERTATNAGNFPAPVTIRVTGPVSNPLLALKETGEQFRLDGVTLASGEWIEVCTAIGAARYVQNQSGADLYRYVRFPTSTWFQLAAGLNTVQLWGDGSDSSTRVDVTWRDCWC